MSESLYEGLASDDRVVKHGASWMVREAPPATLSTLQTHVYERFLLPLFHSVDANGVIYHRVSDARLAWLYRWLGPAVRCLKSETFAASAQYVQLLGLMEFLKESWVLPEFRPFEDATSSVALLRSASAGPSKFILRLSSSAPGHIAITCFQRTNLIVHMRYRVTRDGHIEDLDSSSPTPTPSSLTLQELCAVVSLRIRDNLGLPSASSGYSGVMGPTTYAPLTLATGTGKQQQHQQKHSAEPTPLSYLSTS